MKAILPLHRAVQRTVLLVSIAAAAGLTSGCAHLALRGRTAAASSMEASNAIASEKLAALGPAPQFDVMLNTTVANLRERAAAGIDTALEATSSSPAPETALPIITTAELARHREFRWLAHLRAAPLLQDDLALFDAYLCCHDDVLSALDASPSLVVNGAFLTAHPDLAAFLDRHPGLSTVLLERTGHRRASTTTT